MSSRQKSGRSNGLRVMAVGVTILAIALVWSGLMLDQRRGLLITLLWVSLVLVLFGAVASLAAEPGELEGSSWTRRAVLAAVPVVVVAVVAILATALFWVSSARESLRVVDDPSSLSYENAESRSTALPNSSRVLQNAKRTSVRPSSGFR